MKNKITGGEMNREEFRKNRQIFRMLSTDMFNQMNNMYDQLAVSEHRIENARKEGYADGQKDGYAAGYVDGILSAHGIKIDREESFKKPECCDEDGDCDDGGCPFYTYNGCLYYGNNEVRKE